MRVKFRRLLALLLLLCMPVQALAALDLALCPGIGEGDPGIVVVADLNANYEHESLDFGGVQVDSCALCHIGCTPIGCIVAAPPAEVLARIFVPSLAAACIECDPTPSLRPPRAPLL